jgi:hypothetical protein
MAQVDDAAGTAGTEVDWENTADEAWAQRALDFYQRRQLQVQAFNTEGVVSAQVWGTCPRCGHDLDIQMTLSAPVITWRGGWLSPGQRKDSGVPADVEVGCGCGFSHAGAPEHVTGCGVSFRLPTAPPAP